MNAFLGLLPCFCGCFCCCCRKCSRLAYSGRLIDGSVCPGHPAPKHAPNTCPKTCGNTFSNTQIAMRNNLPENLRENLSENLPRKKSDVLFWEYVEFLFEEKFRSNFRGLLWHIDSRPVTPICGVVFRAVVPSHRSRLSPSGVTWPSAGPGLESFCEQHKSQNATPSLRKQANFFCVMAVRVPSPWPLWRQ